VQTLTQRIGQYLTFSPGSQNRRTVSVAPARSANGAKQATPTSFRATARSPPAIKLRQTELIVELGGVAVRSSARCQNSARRRRRNWRDLSAIGGGRMACFFAPGRPGLAGRRVHRRHPTLSRRAIEPDLEMLSQGPHLANRVENGVAQTRCVPCGSDSSPAT